MRSIGFPRARCPGRPWNRHGGFDSTASGRSKEPPAVPEEPPAVAGSLRLYHERRGVVGRLRR